MKHVFKLLNLSELQFISGNDGNNQFTQFRKFLWAKGNRDNYLEKCASPFRLQARYPQHCINVSGLQFLIREGGSPHVPFQRRSLSVALCQVVYKCSAFLSVLCVRGSRGRSCSERFNGLALPFTVHLAGDYPEGSRGVCGLSTDSSKTRALGRSTAAARLQVFCAIDQGTAAASVSRWVWQAPKAQGSRIKYIYTFPECIQVRAGSSNTSDITPLNESLTFPNDLAFVN